MDLNAQASSNANMQPSLFLNKLPGEMRNEIYHCALVFPKSVCIQPSTINSQRSLLQSCHQIREEASEIYYSKNAFFISSSLTGIHDITGFLYSKDKSIGKMVDILIIIHTLGEDKLKLRWNPILTNAFGYSHTMLPGISNYHQEKALKEATAAAHELSRVGVAETSIVVFKQVNNKVDGIERSLDQLRKVFDAQVRSVVSAMGS